MPTLTETKFAIAISEPVPIHSDHYQPPKTLHALHTYVKDKRKFFVNNLRHTDDDIHTKVSLL